MCFKPGGTLKGIEYRLFKAYNISEAATDLMFPSDEDDDDDDDADDADDDANTSGYEVALGGV